MKNFFVKTMLSVFLLLPFSIAVPVGAVVTPQVNVTGDYIVEFVYSGPYFHDMNLVQDINGNITGNGGFPSQGPYSYSWKITNGTIVGNQLNLTILYDIGATGTIMHMIGTVASNGTMSGTWDDNFGGLRNGTWSATVGTAALLLSEDFGVVNYNTGIGQLKGYTAGFGLTNANFANAQSVVAQLYAGSTLLQTNTATAKVGLEITGSQISTPFDVSGSFNYTADGYWTNVRASEYGQSVAATRVVLTVILANGRVLMAENTNLTGNSSTIFSPVTPIVTPISKDQCKNNGWKNFENFSFKNQGQCVSNVQHLLNNAKVKRVK